MPEYGALNCLFVPWMLSPILYPAFAVLWAWWMRRKRAVNVQEMKWEV
jgi:hypothetical protein